MRPLFKMNSLQESEVELGVLSGFKSEGDEDTEYLGGRDIAQDPINHCRLETDILATNTYCDHTVSNSN